MSEGLARHALLQLAQAQRAATAAGHIPACRVGFLRRRRGDPAGDRAARRSRRIYLCRQTAARTAQNHAAWKHRRRIYDRDLAAGNLYRQRRLVSLWTAIEAGLSGLRRSPLHRVGTFSVHAPVTFLVILYLTWRWGWKVALVSTVIGTAAAPMIFEFPFDLIIMTRSNPPIPAHPMLYRQLLYVPLFLAELSTISLLTLLPSMRVTAYAAYAVAGMFLVFAVWAAFSPFLRNRCRLC